jgi:hypothetical protein
MGINIKDRHIYVDYSYALLWGGKYENDSDNKSLQKIGK